MNIGRLKKLLETLEIATRFGRGGYVTAHEIMRWTDMPKSTTYHYLKYGRDLGFVNEQVKKTKRGRVSYWAISDRGINWIAPELAGELW